MITIHSEKLKPEEYIDFLKRTDLGSQYPRERFSERIPKLLENASISLTARNDENRIVGIITFDDVMDVMADESAEDIAKMGAVAPQEDSYFETSVWSHVKSRIGWLLVLMISATLTGFITNRFDAQIAAVPLLVAFMPMLTDTGGSCGSQSTKV